METTTKERHAKYILRFIGLICALFAVGLTTLIALGLISFFRQSPALRLGPKEAVVVFIVLIIIDWFFLIVAYRLIACKQRKDGGLFSPTALRLAGIMFLLFPVVGVITKSWYILLDSWYSLAAAAGCFALAHHRSEKVKLEKEEIYRTSSLPIEPK